MGAAQPGQAEPEGDVGKRAESPMRGDSARAAPATDRNRGRHAMVNLTYRAERASRAQQSPGR